MIISIFKSKWGELTMMIIMMGRMIMKTMTTKCEEEWATLQGGSRERRDHDYDDDLEDDHDDEDTQA